MNSQNVTVGQEVLVRISGKEAHFAVGTVERILKNGWVVRVENRSIRFASSGVEFAPKNMGCTVDFEWGTGSASEKAADLNSQLEKQNRKVAALFAKWKKEEAGS